MNCVVCDGDEQYARKLAEYMNRQKELNLTAQPFTDPDKLLSYAQRQKVDVLLINENQLNDQIRQEVMTCCAFSENTMSPGALSKYSSAAMLVRAALRSVRKTGTGLGNILAVYSPIGRCGKTWFALTLAGVLSEKSPVLYINLEDYPYLGLERKGEGGDSWETNEQATLSDLLYSLHGTDFTQPDQTKAAAFLREAVEKRVQTKGNLDLLLPAVSSCDLRDISLQEWKGILSMLGNATSYDYLVLDVGAGMPDVYQILSLCGKVYVPVLDDVFSQAKMARFEMTLRMLRGEEGMLEGRIRKIRLPNVRIETFEDDDFLEKLLSSPMRQAAVSALGRKRQAGN